MKPEREIPLFILDPGDDKRKHIGTKQVFSDGSLVWYKRITTSHVMRIGQLGFDAMTFETQFIGRAGYFKVVYGDHTYTADFSVMETKGVMKDYGHGRQWMLDFHHWDEQQVEAVNPLRPGTPRPPILPKQLVFGEVVECRACFNLPKSKQRNCTVCHGAGYVTR